MGIFSKPDPHALLEKSGDIEGAIKLLNHRDPKIRKLTINAMCLYKNDEFIEPLIQTVEEEDNDEVKDEALKALYNYRSTRLIKPLARWQLKGTSCMSTLCDSAENLSPSYKMDEETFRNLREIVYGLLGGDYFWLQSLINSFSKLNDPRCIEIFEKVLSVELPVDPDSRSRANLCKAYACRGLEALGFPGIMVMLRAFLNNKKECEKYGRYPRPENIFSPMQELKPEERRELFILVRDNRENPAMASLQEEFERNTRGKSSSVQKELKSIFCSADIKE